MKNFLQQSVLFASALFLVACGGGGSGGSTPPPVVTNSSTPVISSSVVASSSLQSSSLASSSLASSSVATRPAQEITQTYSVTVDVPSSFLTQAAEAATTNLNESRFAVVVVDLAGNIVEKIPLYAGEVLLNADGSWSVSFPASPRLDYVIVVDINKPLDLAVGSNIRQDDLVYAPITDTSVDIDVGSTAAYSNLLEELGGTGSFASQNFDPTDPANITFVEQALNSIQEIIAGQSLSQFGGVTAALAALKTQVAGVVAQELLNIESAVAGSAATLIGDEGGMYTYLAFDDGTGLDINYDALVGTQDLASYHYNGTTFVPAPVLAIEQGLVLSSAGWVTPGHGTRVTSFNEDGSVLTEWVAAEGVKIKLEAEQVFDLTGRNIQSFLQTDIDTQGLATVVNSASTFASDAKGYRIKSSFVDTVYTLPLNSASDSAGVCLTDDNNNGVFATALGGNCNALELWGPHQQYLSAITSLSDIFSPDVEPDGEGFRAVSYWQSVVVQLLNDSAQTARFYLQTGITVDADTPQTILIGSGTWAQLTLPYLTEDAAAIQVQMTTPLDENYLLPDLQVLLVKQAGFIRAAQGFTGFSSVESSFNAAANTSILGALTGGNPVSASPTSAAIRTQLTRAKSLP